MSRTTLLATLLVMLVLLAPLQQSLHTRCNLTDA